MATCTNCQIPLETDADQSDLRCGPCDRASKTEPSIKLTPLARDDLELVLAWRSNPEIYRYFRQQDSPLDWDDHVAWFNSRPNDRSDFIIHYDGRRVGVVSIDEDEEVGIYLGDTSARGEGVATSALNWLCDRFEQRTPLFAEIHEENEASRRLFRRCGFQREGIDEEWEMYIYDPTPEMSSQ